MAKPFRNRIKILKVSAKVLQWNWANRKIHFLQTDNFVVLVLDTAQFEIMCHIFFVSGKILNTEQPLECRFIIKFIWFEIYQRLNKVQEYSICLQKPKVIADLALQTIVENIQLKMKFSMATTRRIDIKSFIDWKIFEWYSQNCWTEKL